MHDGFRYTYGRRDRRARHGLPPPTPWKMRAAWWASIVALALVSAPLVWVLVCALGALAERP